MLSITYFFFVVAGAGAALVSFEWSKDNRKQVEGRKLKS